jgi:DNA-binding transcriptional regulator YiaG
VGEERTIMAQAYAIEGPLVKPYRYTQCGLDDVYLLNGYHMRETPYGAGVAIQDVEDLHRAIAEHLVKNKPLLNGKEIRFLRKLIDLTQAELALLLGCNVQTVARWEKGQSEVNGPADKMIRVLYLAHSEGRPMHDLIKIIQELSQLDSPQGGMCVFEETDDGWRKAAA